MQRAKGDGVVIQLAIREGKAKPILCVHGLTANCRCWDLIASELAPTYRVLAMDLRGRGLSDKPARGYSLERHVRDIHGVLNDLGLEQAVLMGHSLGAYIAMAFAADCPERVEKLVLLDGGAALTPEQWDQVALGIKPSVDRLGQIFPSWPAFLETMKQAPFLHPWSPFIEEYFRYEIEEIEGGVRSRTHPAHIREEVANLRQVEPARFYPQLSCPVLILRATEGLLSRDDLVLPEAAVERMLREISGARRVDLPGSNHYSILLQPNEMRDRALRSFLEP
ncbi:MAG: alpha/beta hydrolase [Desulfobacterales bacterium]|nr:MAG: alpha/beta hydrolase [Desulfobacterales bacterium]